MKPTLSIIIPAFNEESNLQENVHNILSAMQGNVSSYEILILDDGSTDQTSAISEQLAARDPNIKVFHNDQNQGLGYCISIGYEKASKEYVMWYPADGGFQNRSLIAMMEQVGRGDIIIPYVDNPGFRSRRRQLISQWYVTFLNFIFRLNLRYYNGAVIYRTSLVKAVKPTAHGFGFLAEVLILLIKEGHPYVEIPTYHQQINKESTVFRFKNFVDIFRMVLRLLWKIRLKNKEKEIQKQHRRK